MPLTRPFTHTLAARAQRDPAFRSALLIEATDAFLSGDIDTGKALLRDNQTFKDPSGRPINTNQAGACNAPLR